VSPKENKKLRKHKGKHDLFHASDNDEIVLVRAVFLVLLLEAALSWYKRALAGGGQMLKLELCESWSTPSK
jgi:hypothetical protein